MPRRTEVDQLGKTSFWLAQTLAHVVQLHAGLAAMDPISRDKGDKHNRPLLADAEDRLAMAIEGFGEVLRNGDQKRIGRVVAELEVPHGVSRRPGARPPYRDLVRWREADRALWRRLERLREDLARPTTKGSERRRLRAEIRSLEEVLG